MATQITANLPATFGKEGFGTTPAAVDTITEYTAGNGVTVDKALTAGAGLTVTGNETVSGTLGVTGAATFSATLAVTGAITATGGNAAAGGFSVSARLFHTGGTTIMASTDGNDSTPVNTEVYIAEVYIDANATLTGVAMFNGSVASGNIKVGLADSAGNIVATSASTAMSGTDAFQRVPFTATYAAKGPATYYVLLFVDNNTARVNCWPIGNFGAAKQTGQVYATGFTAITPPTTFTANLGPIASLY